jgi:hypothetical protein
MSSGAGGAATTSTTLAPAAVRRRPRSTTASDDGDGRYGAIGTGGGRRRTGRIQGGAPVTAAGCFADDYVNPLMGGPDYDQFSPTIGSHCMGTNQQDITGIQRVVFLGDSITVGTPPTLSGDFYRSLLADQLATKFGISAPNGIWKAADPVNGTSIIEESGAFASCSKWGARTDDLLTGGAQIADCFPQDKMDQRTLVVMTMGGNDVSSLAQDATNGASSADLWTATQSFVQLQREAIEWLYTPGRFPNGVFVVFANNYEFTDGTGEVQSCDVSGLAGFDQPLPNPQEVTAMIVWANEQYLRSRSRTART